MLPYHISQTSLQVAPPLELYENPGKCLHLGIPGKIQRTNASLAIKLSEVFLSKTHEKIANDAKIHVSIEQSTIIGTGKISYVLVCHLFQTALQGQDKLPDVE